MSGGSKAHYTFAAFVVKVIDGDTFDARVDLGFNITIKQRFRIAEFDALESYRPRNSYEKEHGEQAKQFAEDLLLARMVKLTSFKTGKYGRYIAKVELDDDLDFKEVMVAHGFSKLEEYNSDWESRVQKGEELNA